MDLPIAENLDGRLINLASSTSLGVPFVAAVGGGAQ